MLLIFSLCPWMAGLARRAATFLWSPFRRARFGGFAWKRGPAGSSRGRPSVNRSTAGHHGVDVRPVENVGMNGLQRAGLVQALALRGRNLKIERRQVVVELRQLGGADDGGGDAGLGGGPVERHLGGRLVHLLGRAEERAQNLPIVFSEPVKGGIARAFRHLVAALADARVAGAVIFPGEEAAGERAPGKDCNPQFLSHGDVLALD